MISRCKLHIFSDTDQGYVRLSYRPMDDSSLGYFLCTSSSINIQNFKCIYICHNLEFIENANLLVKDLYLLWMWFVTIKPVVFFLIQRGTQLIVADLNKMFSKDCKSCLTSKPINHGYWIYLIVRKKYKWILRNNTLR